jgi:hypothetical protein
VHVKQQLFCHDGHKGVGERRKRFRENTDSEWNVLSPNPPDDRTISPRPEQARVVIGVFAGRLIFERHEKIQITAFGIETPIRGGANQIRRSTRNCRQI